MLIFVCWYGTGPKTERLPRVECHCSACQGGVGKKLRQALILVEQLHQESLKAIPSWWFTTRRDDDTESKRRELGNKEMNPVDDQ